LLPKTETVTIL